MLSRLPRVRAPHIRPTMAVRSRNPVASRRRVLRGRGHICQSPPFSPACIDAQSRLSNRSRSSAMGSYQRSGGSYMGRRPRGSNHPPQPAMTTPNAPSDNHIESSAAVRNAAPKLRGDVAPVSGSKRGNRRGSSHQYQTIPATKPANTPSSSQTQEASPPLTYFPTKMPATKPITPKPSTWIRRLGAAGSASIARRLSGLHDAPISLPTLWAHPVGRSSRRSI